VSAFAPRKHVLSQERKATLFLAATAESDRLRSRPRRSSVGFRSCERVIVYFEQMPIVGRSVVCVRTAPVACVFLNLRILLLGVSSMSNSIARYFLSNCL
jgi:hypothetical protein